MNLSDCLFLHWTLVGSLVLLVEAVHFSSARKAGGPSQPFLNQIWDLVLRRSYKDHLFKVRRIWEKMLTMSLQCVFIALGLKRCRSDIGCFWLPLVAFGCSGAWIYLTACFCTGRLLGSLVLLVEAVHFSSARKAGGPSQPLLNQIWDLVLRRSYKDHLFKVRRIWEKMLTMSLQCVFIALGLKRCRSDGCSGAWIYLTACFCTGRLLGR